MEKKKVKVHVPICYFHGIALKRNEKCFPLHQDLKKKVCVPLPAWGRMHRVCVGAFRGQSPWMPWNWSEAAVKAPGVGAGNLTQIRKSHVSSPHIKMIFDKVFLCSLACFP